MTVLCDAPGSVTQLLPAESVSTRRPIAATLPVNQSRASLQTGPQASRCAPSGVDVRAASSRRSAITRWAFTDRIIRRSASNGVTIDEAGQQRLFITKDIENAEVTEHTVGANHPISDGEMSVWALMAVHTLWLKYFRGGVATLRRLRRGVNRVGRRCARLALTIESKGRIKHDVVIAAVSEPRG